MQRVVEVARSAAFVRVLHWSPDGERLGVVRSDVTQSLHVWSQAEGLSHALDSQPIRHFAGWCAAGDHLAYVVPSPVLGSDAPLWSFLLIPDAGARDSVVIADGAGRAVGRPVLSGLRVTFPH